MQNIYNRSMLLDLALSLFVIALLLGVTEYLWRSKQLEIEVSRKIIHMGTGVVIAFWPFYLPWSVIQILSLAMLVAILISYKLHFFKSIHSVERITRGEILYPIGIGICALLEPATWVFTAAILHLAIADSMAALVGVKYGKNTRYKILSHGKSLAGSLAFFVTSFCILASASIFIAETTAPDLWAWFLWGALILTIIENLSWYGTDDITVPVGVILILTMFPI